MAAGGEATEHEVVRGARRRLRGLFFVLQLVFVAALAACWFVSGPVRHSKSLWILFFYSFPSEFLIAVVPHEPALFFFAEAYPPLVVALVSLASTVLAEALNYSVFSFLVDTELLRRARSSRIVERLVALFRRAPFTALIVAGLLPAPFYPIRILAFVSRYPRWKFLASIVVSRGPRFYLLALLGLYVRVPPFVWGAVILAFVVASAAPALLPLARKGPRHEAPAQSADEGGTGAAEKPAI